MLFKVITLILVSHVYTTETNSSQPTTKTPYGLVQGIIEDSPSGKKVDAYYGVPFAGPPLNEYRFKPPPSLKPWDGIFNATSQPPTCFQKKQPLSDTLPALEILKIQTRFSEDCLYLNIWVPQTEKPLEGLPVMVYIHGGGFSRGAVSYSSLIGSVLTSEENVILVAPSYRVGALGFAFLNDTEVPGNAGLYDQLAALKWIKESISSFSGNPEKVTIFGHSAGASSVGHLMLSSLTSGLFQRGIMESGGAHSYFAYKEPSIVYHNTTQLIDHLGCPNDNLTAAIQCLQKADPMEIVLSEPQGDYDMVYTFQPTTDGKMVLKDPIEVLKEGKFEKRDILLGTNKDEAAVFLPAVQPFLFPFNDKLQVTQEDMRETLFSVSPFSEVVQIVISLLYEGGQTVNDSAMVVKIGSRILSDFVFSCPVLDTAKYNSEVKSRVFLYYLIHRSSVSQFPRWMGTTHGEELNFVFGKVLFPEEGYKPEEISLSKRMMRYWANFARTGDPNEGVSGKEPIRWPRYTPESREFLVLAPNSKEIGKDLKAKKCAFWRDYRPLLELNDKSREARSHCN